MILDGLMVGVCLWVCYLLRSTGIICLDRLGEIPSFSHTYWMLALIIPLTPLILDLQGYYEHPLSQRLEILSGKIAKAGFWLILVIGTASIFGRLEIPSRSVLILFIILAPAFLILRVGIMRKYLIHHYNQGIFGERSILVGSDADGDAFLARLSASERLELQIIGRLDPASNDAKTILKSIRQNAVGRVIFVSPQSPANHDLPMICESEGLVIWIVSESIHGIVGMPSFELAGKNRVLVFRKAPGDFWQRFIKRILDICGATVGMIVFAPLCLLIAILIKATSPGPVIFSQVRSGKRGKRFTIYKFRSMVANAPELHAKLSEHNEMEGPVFKINKDPRVTRFGELLRRTSLDEIPQLLNVLRGEMSIVGPRPLPDYETELIEKSTHRRRLSVKPGLTCLWQIQGRNSIKSFDDWVQLDIEYIDRETLLLDLWIILRTIPAVLFRKGAR
ncbi:MAG: sugar transferase [Verrucomicrobia bacterium]|nr:sugar transferase [Verrucomicrobiota bacterium]